MYYCFLSVGGSSLFKHMWAPVPLQGGLDLNYCKCLHLAKHLAIKGIQVTYENKI